jgi:hypothetical protein
MTFWSEKDSSGNFLKDTMDVLKRKKYDHPVESVTRLTVIDLTGQALFALTNTTPNVIPTQWKWSNLQGQ